VLGYLLAYTLAPLVRRLAAVVLVVGALAFLVTLPARLWVRYVSPLPNDVTIVTFNFATFVVVVGTLLILRYRRRKIRR
jgi:hypothetical protein